MPIQPATPSSANNNHDRPAPHHKDRRTPPLQEEASIYQCVRWAFTINAPGDWTKIRSDEVQKAAFYNELQRAATQMEAFITKFCEVGVQEYEEGETDGRPHVQGFFYLEKKMRVDTLRRLWRRGSDEDEFCFDLLPDLCHLDRAYASVQQNWDYCSKWHFGDQSKGIPAHPGSYFFVRVALPTFLTVRVLEPIYSKLLGPSEATRRLYYPDLILRKVVGTYSQTITQPWLGQFTTQGDLRISGYMDLTEQERQQLQELILLPIMETIGTRRMVRLSGGTGIVASIRRFSGMNSGLDLYQNMMGSLGFSGYLINTNSEWNVSTEQWCCSTNAQQLPQTDLLLTSLLVETKNQDRRLPAMSIWASSSDVLALSFTSRELQRIPDYIDRFLLTRLIPSIDSRVLKLGILKHLILNPQTSLRLFPDASNAEYLAATTQPMTLIVNSEWKHLVMDAEAIISQPHLEEGFPMPANWSTEYSSEHPLEGLERSIIYPHDSFDNWGDEPDPFDIPAVVDWMPEAEMEGEEESSSEFALL